MGHRAVIFCASAVSLVVGAVGGYFYAKGRLETRYMEAAEIEIAEARQRYALRYQKYAKDGEYATPESAAKTLLGADANEEDTQELRVFNKTIEDFNALARNQGYSRSPDHDEEEIEWVDDIPVQVERNVAEGPMRQTRQDREFQREVSSRNHGKPYIISKDEFFENDGGYSEAQFAYYAGDDTMADSREQVIEDIDDMFGGKANLRFGHLSEDPTVVYIRNERYNLILEVTLNRGSYGEEVQGFVSAPTSDKEWYRESNPATRGRFEGRRYNDVVGGDHE